jgi:hypothetical protein
MLTELDERRWLDMIPKVPMHPTVDPNRATWRKELLRNARQEERDLKHVSR